MWFALSVTCLNDLTRQKIFCTFAVIHAPSNWISRHAFSVITWITCPTILKPWHLWNICAHFWNIHEKYYKRFEHDLPSVYNICWLRIKLISICRNAKRPLSCILSENLEKKTEPTVQCICLYVYGKCMGLTPGSLGSRNRNIDIVYKSEVNLFFASIWFVCRNSIIQPQNSNSSCPTVIDLTASPCKSDVSKSSVSSGNKERLHAGQVCLKINTDSEPEDDSFIKEVHSPADSSVSILWCVIQDFSLES